MYKLIFIITLIVCDVCQEISCSSQKAWSPRWNRTNNRSPKDLTSKDASIHGFAPKLNILTNLDTPLNSTVTLECTGDKPLDWQLVHACCNISQRLILEESVNPDAGDRKFYSKLKIINTIYSDTGRYICFYNGSETESRDKIVKHASSTSVYIFVNDPERAFAWPRPQALTVVSNKELIVPCRPTSSTLNVTLWNSENVEIIVDKQTVFFDPTKGFIIPRPDHNYDSRVSCKSGGGDAVEFYTRFSINKGYVPQPFINISLAKYPMVNKPFTLTCYVDVDVTFGPGPLNLFWVDSQENLFENSDRITVEDVVFKTTAAGFSFSRSLTIHNATLNDTGLYLCDSRDIHSNGNEEVVEIVVHDKELEPFINITTDITKPFVQKLNTSEVKMVMKVSGTMEINKINMTWRKDDGDVPVSRQRIQISPTKSGSRLVILNLQRNDSGVYTLIARSGNLIANKSIFLHVTAEPLLTISEKLEYYLAGSNYNITCNINGHPKITVWWQWKKCSSFYPLMCDEGWQDINRRYDQSPNFLNISETEIIKLDYYKSSLQVKALESGMYRCNGHNDFTKYEEVQFVVSDIAEDFELKVKSMVKDCVIEGDITTIICRVNLLRYNSSALEMHYRSSDSESFRNINAIGENISVNKTQTNYSQILEVKITNITTGQSGQYYCSTRRLLNDSVLNSALAIVDVKKMVKPYMLQNYSKNVELQYSKSGILNCTVTGLPKPEIIWIKDGLILKSNNVFKITDQGQRLEISFADKKTINGVYICRVENRGGVAKQEYHVKVVGGDEMPSNNSNIILAVVIPIFAVILIVVFAFCLKNLHKERKEQRELEILSQMLFDKGQLEMLNPNMPLDDQVELLPYDHKWEFPKDRLKLGRILGQGAFGRVVRAEAIGLEDGEQSSTVAVKMLKERADLAQRKALMAELKILIHLGKHLNIVNLLGAVTKQMRKGELMVIVEYCRYGNLRNYLLRHKARFVNQLDPETGMLNPELITLPNSPINSVGPPNFNTILSNPIYGRQSSNYADLQHGPSCDSSGEYTTPSSPVSVSTSGGPTFRWLSIKESDYQGNPVTTCDLLCFAFQCARGMEYLASRKLIHRDLAARNVLLAADNIVKICDFGLAKDCYKYNNYIKKGDGLLPIKWMAIESLTDKVFTTKSDVWSFGILLWEFFTLGGDPYPGTDLDEEFYKKLKNGYRMEKPELCPNNIYDLMTQCWSADPDKRSDFQTISEILGAHLANGVKQYYLDLNTPYSEMNVSKQEDYLAMCGQESSDYLNMRTESLSSNTAVQYENINCCTSPGSVPSESVQMGPTIQLDPVHVHWKRSVEELTPTESPEVFFEEKGKSDYLSMVSTIDKIRPEFSRNWKGNESQRSNTSSGFHSDLETSGESIPPSYSLVIEDELQEIKL